MEVIRQRSSLSLVKAIFSGIIRPVASIAMAFLIGSAFIWLMGIEPWAAYRSMAQGALGNLHGVGETLLKTAPILLTGLSCALAFRSGLFNVGAEGQFYCGALGSILVAVYLQGLPSVLHVILALAAGFLGGALWGLLAGWLKVRFGANEIITTVMLNYVASNFIVFLVNGPLQEPTKMFPETAQAAVTAQLPRILPGTRLHLGFLLAILGVIFYYVYLWRSWRGFELRVIGLNFRAAHYAGMDAQAGILRAIFLAGGLAGLAGSGEVLGVHFKLMGGISPGYGFDGLTVALLGNAHPVGVLFSALLFGFLRTGGNMMQMFARVPVALIYIIQALVIFFTVVQVKRGSRG